MVGAQKNNKARAVLRKNQTLMSAKLNGFIHLVKIYSVEFKNKLMRIHYLVVLLRVQKGRIKRDT